MDHITEFHDLIRKYRTLVQYENDGAEEKLKAIEPMQGSRYYEEQSEEIEKKRMKEIKKHRESISKQLDKCLESMRKNAERLAPEAPTQEMVDALTLLKMKENPQWDEVRSVAEICQTNPQALGVVEEIATKHHIPLPATPRTFGSRETFAALDGLLRYASVTLKLDKVNNKKEWFQMSHEWSSGVKDTTNGAASDFWLYDRECDSAKETAMSFGNINSESEYNDFVKAVND